MTLADLQQLWSSWLTGLTPRRQSRDRTFGLELRSPRGVTASMLSVDDLWQPWWGRGWRFEPSPCCLQQHEGRTLGTGPGGLGATTSGEPAAWPRPLDLNLAWCCHEPLHSVQLPLSTSDDPKQRLASLQTAPPNHPRKVRWQAAIVLRSRLASSAHHPQLRRCGCALPYCRTQAHG